MNSAIPELASDGSADEAAMLNPAWGGRALTASDARRASPAGQMPYWSLAASRETWPHRQGELAEYWEEVGVGAPWRAFSFEPVIQMRGVEERDSIIVRLGNGSLRLPARLFVAGMLADSVAWGGVTALTYIISVALLRRWRTGLNRCPSCGYLLSGIAASTCPECGATASAR